MHIYIPVLLTCLHELLIIFHLPVSLAKQSQLTYIDLINIYDKNSWLKWHGQKLMTGVYLSFVSE